jgi:hypothetical protein
MNVPLLFLQLFCLLSIYRDFYVLFKQWGWNPCYNKYIYCQTFIHVFRNELCVKVTDCLYVILHKSSVMKQFPGFVAAVMYLQNLGSFIGRYWSIGVIETWFGPTQNTVHILVQVQVIALFIIFLLSSWCMQQTSLLRWYTPSHNTAWSFLCGIHNSVMDLSYCQIA